jgi:integrase/recombinase XerC
VQPETELYIFRRHLRTCQFFGPGGREVRSDKCHCPFHADGFYHGRRHRQGLKTRNRRIAEQRLAELIRKIDAAEALVACGSGVGPTPPQNTIADAVERFLKQYGEMGADGLYRGDYPRSTWRKYRAGLQHLTCFCTKSGFPVLADVTIEVLEDYRRQRDIGPVTWKVELQTLRTFFAYCMRLKWISTNPAKELKSPRNLKPNEVVPYTLEEESRILSACDQIGGGIDNLSGASYEQPRVRAMVMLLRHTALRVSDVCTLRKDAVSWHEEASTWRVLLRTQKSGQPVFLPIPEHLKLALDALPLPRNAARDCPYYFWNGVTSGRAVVGIAERTLASVFKKSGVQSAHAHRYRHTLATRLLERGAALEQVADILGNSPEIVRKHYGKWSKERQANIDRLMIDHFGTALGATPVTPPSHEEMEAVN